MLSVLCRTLTNPCCLAFFTLLHFALVPSLPLYLTACIESFIPTSAHNVFRPYLRVLRVCLWVWGNGDWGLNGMGWMGIGA